jgi:hypothetical protein
MTIRHDIASPKPPVAQAYEASAKLFTVDELIRTRAAELGDSSLIGCPVYGVADFEEHSARSVDKYADAAVVKLRELGLEPVVSVTQ